MNLKEKAIAGVKWTTAASVVNTIVQLAQLAILARILETTDFGLMALVMVVIDFSQMFIDMGISNAIIYRQNINKEQLSSIYWLNVLIGFLFFILLVLISPLFSNFYQHEELTRLICLVSITFLIKPWGQQYMVLLQKNLNFYAIAKTDILSRLVSFCVVIILAYNNFGVYSIAIGTLIFSVFTTLGYILYGYKDHKVTLHFKRKDLTGFFRFGFYQMGEKMINFFSAQFDTLLIGKILGLEILGIYNIAKNLVSKPSVIINPVVTKVTFPLMSKINEDMIQLRQVFLKSVNYLSFINFPVYMLICVLAYPLVVILFGEDWLNAVSLVQILSLTYMLRSFGNPSGSLLLALGKANVAFYWNLITFIFYPISIFVGSLYGVVGIAWATFILQLCLIYPNWKFIVNKACMADIKSYFGTLFFPLIISIASIVLPLVLFSIIENNVSILVIGGVGYVLSYITLLYVLQPRITNDFKGLIFSSFKSK